MRIVAGVTVTGYWRSPNTPPRAIDLPDVPFDDAFDADDLPHQLETLTRHSLKELRRILRLPLDQNNGNLLRAKVTASLGVLQSQLRADDSRMRVRAAEDVLSRLEKLMREQRKLLPKQDHPISIDAMTGEPIARSAKPDSA
jgi:hypothetical protein